MHSDIAVRPSGASALPSTAPSATGTDAAGILRFVRALEASPTQEPHGLMVLRHGRVVAQGWWAPYAHGRRHLLYSLSKSFTSAAAGLAVAEGLLRLDDPVLAYFPEVDPETVDPRTRRMLVRHVASMASGHTRDTFDEAFADPDVDPVHAFLRIPPDEEPGSVFAYNQPATYTLGAIVQRVTGGSLLDYLRPRLLDPLGIGPLGWQERPAGRQIAFTGLFAPTDAVARLGQLLLQRGRWGDRQLLPAEWVDAATSVQVGTPRPFGGPGETVDTVADPPASDWQQGYGFQHWMSRHGFRGDGAYGQFCVVLPEHDVVVAVTAQTPDMQETLDLAWQHLLPAFAGPGSPEADEELAAHLAAASVPALALPGSGADWSGRVFGPDGGSCAAQPSLAEVRVGPGWALTLVDRGGDVTAAFDPGSAGWTLTDAGTEVPVATSGGVEPDGRVRVRLAFLEAPHRLELVLDGTAGTFEAHWATEPLRFVTTPLRALATPATLT
ncbi:serine hydrolase domain-containing protein [Luteimicrobium sp. NPDC057192]|uniref:serine hydrolase domain-containing protein n=1 Tax=Luteimicrobium sp. NPDC057192 TaxID=3346042 RepID=UPI003627AC7D